jgi:hypothetical protein
MRVPWSAQQLVVGAAPSNNEMKRTKPAPAGMARSSPLISVFAGHQTGTGNHD